MSDHPQVRLEYSSDRWGFHVADETLGYFAGGSPFEELEDARARERRV